MLRQIKNHFENYCGIVTTLVQQFCDANHVPCEIAETHVSGVGHYVNVLDGRVVDFTLLQFLPHAPWPYVEKPDHPDVKQIYGDLSVLTEGERMFVMDGVFEDDPRGGIFKNLLDELLRIYATRKA
jgi:hypothetical protein